MWALPEAEGRNDMSRQQTLKLAQLVHRKGGESAYRVLQTANTTTPKINEVLTETQVKKLIALTGTLSYTVTIVAK